MAQSVFPVEPGQKLPGDDCNENTTGVAPLDTLNDVLTRSPTSSLAVRILGLIMSISSSIGNQND